MIESPGDPSVEPIEFDTLRLRMRQWQPSDRPPFAALSADQRVMAYFPGVLTRTESDAMADRCETLIARRGWGFWAAELKTTHEFIGVVGLHEPALELPFSPCVEIGWRLAHDHWHQGLAVEAACAALEIGFAVLGMHEIVSFTAVDNRRSRRVMERLGMHHAEDFEHPALPVGHALRRHCLYRLPRDLWIAECSRRNESGV